MQLKPWIVAVNFGDGMTAQLYVNAIVAPTSELAVAHVVAMTLQQIKTDQPLTRIMWQEVEAEFLTAALSLMRGAAAGEKVVSLRVVEESKTEVPPPEHPLDERLQSDFGHSGPGQEPLPSERIEYNQACIGKGCEDRCHPRLRCMKMHVNV